MSTMSNTLESTSDDISEHFANMLLTGNGESGTGPGVGRSSNLGTDLSWLGTFGKTALRAGDALKKFVEGKLKWDTTSRIAKQYGVDIQRFTPLIHNATQYDRYGKSGHVFVHLNLYDFLIYLGYAVSKGNIPFMITFTHQGYTFKSNIQDHHITLSTNDTFNHSQDGSPPKFNLRDPNAMLRFVNKIKFCGSDISNPKNTVTVELIPNLVQSQDMFEHTRVVEHFYYAGEFTVYRQRYLSKHSELNHGSCGMCFAPIVQDINPRTIDGNPLCIMCGVSSSNMDGTTGNPLKLELVTDGKQQTGDKNKFVDGWYCKNCGVVNSLQTTDGTFRTPFRSKINMRQQPHCSNCKLGFYETGSDSMFRKYMYDFNKYNISGKYAHKPNDVYKQVDSN